MLWDPKNDEQLKQLEAESLLQLDKPSLKALSYILRHREHWPEGFTWSFPNCEQCAMGLARNLWDKKHDPLNDVDDACNWAVDFLTAERRFVNDVFGGNIYLCSRVPLGLVTPEMIANKIDEHLATQK
jgi:hypothetical protein